MEGDLDTFSSATNQHYDPQLFATLFAIEDEHFWFQARNKVISTVVSQITINFPSGYRVLEVGCGTGNTLRILGKICDRGTVVGMDLFAAGLHYARQRTSCTLIQGNIHTPPYSQQFDMICMFDVLEHLPNDKQVLRNLHELLVKDGFLLLTVPAHSSLWSYADEVAHHCRRYQLPTLNSRLTDTGYHVEYLTQYMATIFPFVWLGRKIAPLFSRSQMNISNRNPDLFSNELRIIPFVNKLLAFLLRQETHIIARRYQIPFGTSLLAIAHKI